MARPTSDSGGVHIAAVTPRGKKGDVNFSAAFELLDHCSRHGARGIVLFGEPGEYPAFSIEERSRLVYLAVKRSRVPVLAGVGSASLDASIALARDACEAGAAGVLVPAPHFYGYGPDEAAEFCLELGRQATHGSPLFLYNTPDTSSPIPVETGLRLLESGFFAGVVDGGADREAFGCWAAAAANGSFRLFSARDSRFVEARSAGFDAVSSAACAVPELYAALDRAIAAQDRLALDRLTGAGAEFLSWAERFPAPVAVKAAVGLRDIDMGPPAVPLSPPKQLLLDEFRAWFQAWLPQVVRMSAHV
jgi:4-hydroxy-tetrahydrodipicolinate synthase